MPFGPQVDSSACESKTAQRMNKAVSSRISFHFSPNASSSFSSSVSDKFGGGNTFTRPSSSSYRRVFTSTLASGQSFLASRASSVSFLSRISRSLSALAPLSMANYLLNSFDKHSGSADLPPCYSNTGSRFPIIGSFSNSQRKSQVADENPRVELLLMNELVIERGLHASVAPFKTGEALSLESHLGSLEHRIVGSANGGIH